MVFAVDALSSNAYYKLEKQYFAADKLDNIDIVGFPRLQNYSELVESLREMRLQAVVGNSANRARRLFGEELASLTNAKYLHAEIKTHVDELSADRFLQEKPDGLSTFEGILEYQKLVVFSKVARIFGLNNEHLDQIGITSDLDLDRTLLFMTDSVSIVNGQRVEKPNDASEAWDQICNIVDSGNPYYLSSMSMAIWASLVRGVGTNVHLLPMRIDPKLGKMGRSELKDKWYELYKSGTVPITPGAVSQANPQIYQHMQIGFMRDPRSHVMKINGVKDIMHSPELEWYYTYELPRVVANEIWTTMTGSPPTGLAMVVESLIEDTDNRKNFFRVVPPDLRRASWLVGGKVPEKLPVC